MRRHLGLVCALACAAGASEEPAPLAPPALPHAAPPAPPRAIVDLETGVRAANFDWRSGNDGPSNPPFSSHWDDLRAVMVGLRAREAPGQTLAVRLAIARGWITDGDNHQAGFSSTTGSEIYQSDNDGSGGWVFEGSADLGIACGSESWLCTPLIGFQGHRQRLRQRDGVQVIPATGPYDGLDSTFDASWYGPRIGIELGYRWEAGPQLRLLGGLAYLWYRGAADWNLRPELDHPESYSQTGRGPGWRVEAALDLPISSRWSCSLRVAWEGIRIITGEDSINVASGEDLDADLTRVREDAVSFILGVGIAL